MSLPAARFGLLSAGILLALDAAAAEPETSLTVYSSAQPGGIPAEWYRPLPGMGTPMANQLPGFALVRLDRELSIPRGRGTIQFTDVAALIDPTTVQFLSLTDPEGTKVLEQNFQFDLVSQDKLLSRYIDRNGQRRAAERRRREAHRRHAGLVERRARDPRRRRPDPCAARMEQHPLRRAAGRPDHAPDARVGRRVRPGRHAEGARVLPDRRHHLVGGLQPDLHRGRGCELGLRGRRRLGEPAQPVGRALPGREAQADRGRREPGAAPQMGEIVVTAMQRKSEMAAARCRVRGEGFLRVPPLHARPSGDDAEQLDQADRAVRRGDARAGAEEARLLRRRSRRLLRRADAGPRARPVVEHRRWTSGSRSATTRIPAWACRCRRAASACRSRTRPTAASSSSARTRSSTRRRTRTSA